MSIDSGDTAWVLASTGVVFLMTPALGLFYGGFVSEKAVVNTMMLSFATLGVVSILWVLVGYSLAFSVNVPSSGAVGDTALGALTFANGADTVRPGQTIPESLFMIFQGMFAVITPAVISGAVVTKMKFWWFLAFAALWHIFVYCPLAHWVWAPDGWLYTYGLLDFAGGTVIETASGVSAFVLAYWLGKPTRKTPINPHNVPYVLLGAALLWFGWMGFNGGSAITSGHLATRALVNTHLAGSMAMFSWSACEWIFPAEGVPFFSRSSFRQDGGWFHGKATAIGAASGIIVGLVAITPACGYVLPMWALFIGFFATIVVFFSLRIIKASGIDDRLDVLGFHGVAGMVGTALTGLFATKQANPAIPTEGAFYGGGSAVFNAQLAGISATILLCAVGTTVIYWVLRGVAWLVRGELTIPEAAREDVDASQHGESAYYRHIMRDVVRAATAETATKLAATVERQVEAAVVAAVGNTPNSSVHGGASTATGRSQEGSTRGGFSRGEGSGRGTAEERKSETAAEAAHVSLELAPVTSQ